MGRDEIVPTYRIPPLVRAVSGSVDQSGVEPPASLVNQEPRSFSTLKRSRYSSTLISPRA
jgi:hypothetical protein